MASLHGAPPDGCVQLLAPPARRGRLTVLGVYDLQERLATDFPDLLLENRCSGGGLSDPGTRGGGLMEAVLSDHLSVLAALERVA